ncbi:centrosomal protein CCDC61 isoform X2 [Opisthocomus hoazin]|uniref:centrosomal protein CCDC61 isoform X2 n=1 Tax=Opisthocomus hoazin TaxID=30419 RepID=UPI003F52F38F
MRRRGEAHPANGTGAGQPGAGLLLRRRRSAVSGPPQRHGGAAVPAGRLRLPARATRCPADPRPLGAGGGGGGQPDHRPVERAVRRRFHRGADPQNGEFQAVWGFLRHAGVGADAEQRVRQPGAPHLRRPGEPAQPENGGDRPASPSHRFPPQHQALPHPRLLRRVRQDPLPAAAVLRGEAGSCRAAAGAEAGAGAAAGSARGRRPRCRGWRSSGRQRRRCGTRCGVPRTSCCGRKPGTGASTRSWPPSCQTPAGAAPRPQERRSASRESRGGSQGRPPPRSPSPAGSRPPRFDPTAFVRARQRRQKEAELKNQRRGATFGSASPARSHGRSSSAESFRSRRSAVSSGSEADERSESLIPRGRRVTRPQRPLSTSSCNGPSVAPRPAASPKPLASNAARKCPGKENRSEEPSAELAEIDARLQALQEYMDSLATRM